MQQISDNAYRLLFTAVVVLLGFGTVFYHYQEHWGYIDSFYFCVVTLATVGYGDFVPKTDVGKLVTTLYIFMGVGLIATFVTARFHRRAEHFQERRGRKEVTDN